VGPSEIHALVGLNGAGKTTLMRILLGMLKPDQGSAHLTGLPVSGAGAHVWSRVGQMLETPFAYPELTARENVYCSARLHGMDRVAAGSAAGRALSDLGLEPYATRRAGTLSLGNRQRVGLAAALVHGPDVLVLDEPTNALDPRGVIVLRRLLQEACREGGAAILVSSHHLDEVARMADRISVLHRGRIIGTLQPAAVDLERRFFDLVLQFDMQEQEQR
jgi:ABC-2 type transport system ATP-binding protein